MVRKINKAGLDLIKKYEGLELKSYKDLRGILTIGYGHTGKDVKEGMTITNTQAHDLLVKDTTHAEECVTAFVEIELTDNQYSALCCLVYNIGCTAFRNSKTLKELNNNNFIEAKKEWAGWNKITKDGKKVVVNGLTNRRIAEISLFSDSTIENKNKNTNSIINEKIDDINNTLNKVEKSINVFSRIYNFFLKRWTTVIPVGGLLNIEIIVNFLKKQPLYILIFIYGCLVTSIGGLLYSLIKNYFLKEKDK